jgi:hypothetical protein
VVGVDRKREVVGYADGRDYVQRCTGLGNVSDGAVNRTASKPFPTLAAGDVGCSVLVHCMTSAMTVTNTK